MRRKLMKIDELVLSLFLTAGLTVPGIVVAACVDDHPVETVMSEGGGQRASVNGTLTATFKGHIMTTTGLTNHGRNVVKICPGTTVEYAVQSSVGGGLRVSPDCADRFNYGKLAIGEKISCNNENLGGRDTDTFTVKAGR
jgi:hypothetical protein